jgi:CheY-like chemotaxis protein
MADGQGRKLVLVVDDEPDIVTYLTTVLQDNGYATESAANGAEAIEKLGAIQPDLVLLDMTMPEKSGVRTYREIRENEATKDLPVIVVTGLSRDFEKFIKTRQQVPPPTDYVAKPIDEAELLAKVKAAIG